MQRSDGLDFLISTQNPAFELEVVESIAIKRRFGERNDTLRCHRLLMAYPEPFIGCVRLRVIR